MKLFSEKVKPTYTSSNHNILTVESLEEVFFDVFEFEINGSTYIAEKETTYKGQPVVSVPVEVGNKKYKAQFILNKGPQEILFNSNTVNKKTINSNTPKSSGLFKESIIHEIDQARISSTKLEKQQHEAKIKKLVESLDLKESKINDIISNARNSFVEEFLNLTENTKLELYETNIQLEDNLKDKLKIYIRESLNDHSDELTTAVKQEHNKSVDLLKENLKDLTDEIYTSTLIKLVEDKDKKNKESFNLLQENLDLKIDDLNEDINLKFKQLDAEVVSISKAKVDIHNELNKSFNKTLSRVGNVKKGLEDTLDSSMKYIEEALESKFTKAEQSARSYFDTKLQVIEESFSGEESKVKAYIFDLIEENKEDLLSKFANYQNEAATVIEQYGDKNVIIDPKKIQDDIQTNLTNTFQQQLMTLRRAVDTYGGGGGSVAKQFADGGTMDGNLTVNGEINAERIYASTLLSAGEINYEFELSGFSVTGDISANGDITGNQLSAVGTSPNYFGGSVGIGTNTPPQELSVKGEITTLNNAGIQVATMQRSSEGYQHGEFILNNSSGVNKLCLNSSGDSFLNGGNVGIGTSTPNFLLDVEGSGADIRLRNTATDATTQFFMRSGGSAGQNQIVFGDDDDSNRGMIRYRHNGDSLAFDVADEEAMRILSDGKVGIGTTAPACSLTVAGTISSQGLKGVSSINMEAAGPIITACSTNNASGIRVNVTGLDGDSDDLLRVQDNGNTRFCIERDGQIFGCSASLTGLSLADNYYACFGSGADLKIRHNGTDSSIANTEGDLYIQNEKDDKSIIFRSDDGSGDVTEYFRVDGQNSVVKFTKDIQVLDGVEAMFGNGGDLKISHDGTNSGITNYLGDFYISNFANDKDIIFRADDGSGGYETYFYLDSSLSTGHPFTIFPDFSYLGLGNNADLRFRHDGTDTTIENLEGNLTITQYADDKDIIFKDDDGAGGVATYFFLDGSSATHDGSSSTALYTNWPDNSLISLGSGKDFAMYHDGTKTLFNTTNCNLEIRNSQDNGCIVFKTDDGSGGTTDYFTIDGNSEILNHHKGTLNADNIQSYYGSGYDLSIWHDGTNSNIRNTTNDLYIANYQDDGDILFQSDDGSGGVTNYLQIDGGGTLTRAYKNIRAQDDVFLQAGSSGDLELVHTADNSYINNKTGDLYITNSVDNQDVFLRTDNGSGGVCNYIQLDGDNISTNLLTTKVNMPNLPTSDPGVAGDLWRDGTDLKISVG
tara:strand:+ start:11895 stop:15602 length:3708 start_codon:yes stop_codon:yes gene_type:complete